MSIFGLRRIGFLAFVCHLCTMQISQAIAAPIKGFVEAKPGEGAHRAGEFAFSEKNYSEALRWFQIAAKEGFGPSQHKIGEIYRRGLGVESDPQQAVFWFRKAADQSVPAAQLALGRAYDTYQSDKGTQKDNSIAVFWYRKAAEQGEIEAQNLLGGMYHNGRGTPRNLQLALYWWQISANAGNHDSQAALGSSYFEGIGVPKDYQRAYYWLILASTNGDRINAASRDDVEILLTQEQRSAAQTAAGRWRPTASDSASLSLAPTPSQSDFKSKPLPIGTAFRITRNQFITSHHVVQDCERVAIGGSPAKVEKFDSRSDLALLSASVQGPTVSLRAQRVAVGEAVLVAGFPLQALLTGYQVTTGTLSALSGFKGDTGQFQITAPVQPGNSGGPLIDMAGRVIGVVVSKLDAIGTARVTGDIPQNVNFAIKANTLRSFLDAAGVEYTVAATETLLPATTIARQAQGYALKVECWR
jgi:TPR repeat protein